MTHFIGVVEQDPGSVCGTWFPDIPGCFSVADDEEDPFPNACQAIILHLEGEQMPAPGKIAEMRRLAKVRRTHARGACLMSVPFLRTGGRKGRLNITGDEEMTSAIADAARQRGITRPAFLMQAARDEICGRSPTHDDRESAISVKGDLEGSPIATQSMPGIPQG